MCVVTLEVKIGVTYGELLLYKQQTGTFLSNSIQEQLRASREGEVCSAYNFLYDAVLLVKNSLEPSKSSLLA